MKGRWVEKQLGPDGRVRFESPGEEIIGVLKGVEEITLFDRRVKRARVQTKQGERTFLLTTQLEALLCDVKPETPIKVRYEGNEKTRVGIRKRFRVWELKPEEPTPEDIVDF